MRKSLFDYDEIGRRWAIEVVAKRRHRTTGRVVEEAWLDELAVLRPIPDRLLADAAGATVDMSNVIDLAAIRAKGAIVSHRGLDEYELDE